MMDVLLRSSCGHELARMASAEDPSVPKAEYVPETWGGDEEQRGGDPASACALWCTIAMGALVQGQPPEQVRTGSGLSLFAG